MDSIWAKTAELPRFNCLKEDLRTDVLIVGGGLAGLLCAHKLAQAGVDYALVEASRICGGTTKGMTAKLTAQHSLIYHKLIRRFGAERARLYLEANLSALDEYRALCQSIDCDYTEADHYVYSLDSREKLERELSARGRPMGQSAMVTASAPAWVRARTPSRKKERSSSAGGSSSTAMTRSPRSRLSARELGLGAGRETAAGAGPAAGRAGGRAAMARAAWARCSGVVPQQPPTMDAPARTTSASLSPK